MGASSFKRSQITTFNKYRSLLVGNPATEPIPDYPAFLDSAPLWLDASDASTITESGGSVSQWDNKGTGSNFVQATSADQPTTGVTTQNGLNVIDFDSSLLQHDGTLGEFKFLHDGTKCFVAVVVSHTSNSEINRVLDSQAGGSSNTGYAVGLDDRFDTDDLFINIGNGSSRIMQIADSGFFPTGFQIQSHLLDLTAATADRADYFRNNTQGTDTNTETGSVNTGDNIAKLTIGAADNGSSPLTGSIAEIIMVSGADATETNRQTVVDYLNDKWSIF